MTSHLFTTRVVVLSLLGAAIAFCAPPSRAADLLNPGEYQWTTKTNAEEARTFSSCVTPEMAKMANGDSRSGREAAERAGKARCTIQAYEIAGNKVSSRMTCGDRELTSTVTYHGDTSEGDLTVTMTAGGTAHVDHVHTSAKRLGACK